MSEIQLKVGGVYRNRFGQEVTIVSDKGTGFTWPFVAESGGEYRPDGGWYRPGTERDCDLIEVVSEPEPEPEPEPDEYTQRLRKFIESLDLYADYEAPGGALVTYSSDGWRVGGLSLTDDQLYRIFGDSLKKRETFITCFSDWDTAHTNLNTTAMPDGSKLKYPAVIEYRTEYRYKQSDIERVKSK